MSAPLLKLDPMVRKLETAIREFKSALDNEDLVSAQQFLRSIAQTSDYLAEDVTAIYKSEVNGSNAIGPNDIYAGGVPVRQFKKSGGIIGVDGERPLGYIGPDGVTGKFQVHRSPGHNV